MPSQIWDEIRAYAQSEILTAVESRAKEAAETGRPFYIDREELAEICGVTELHQLGAIREAMVLFRWQQAWGAQASTRRPKFAPHASYSDSLNTGLDSSLERIGERISF